MANKQSGSNSWCINSASAVDISNKWFISGVVNDFNTSASTRGTIPASSPKPHTTNKWKPATGTTCW
jgi:hypothetical protein